MSLGTCRHVATARTMKRDRLAKRHKVASIRITEAQLICPYCEFSIDVECNEAAWPQSDTVRCTYDGCGAVIEMPAASQLNRLFRTVRGKRR